MQKVKTDEKEAKQGKRGINNLNKFKLIIKSNKTITTCTICVILCKYYGIKRFLCLCKVKFSPICFTALWIFCWGFSQNATMHMHIPHVSKAFPGLFLVPRSPSTPCERLPWLFQKLWQQHSRLHILLHRVQVFGPLTAVQTLTVFFGPWHCTKNTEFLTTGFTQLPKTRVSDKFLNTF